VRSFPDLKAGLAMLKAGAVSAIVLQEPTVTAALEQANLREVVDLASGSAAGMPLEGYFAASTFTDKYPKTTQIFSSVMSGLQALAQRRVVVESALAKQAGADTKVLVSMHLGTYPTEVLTTKLDIVVRLLDGAGITGGMLDSAKLNAVSVTS
jgi:ABC-type nitrate/sulfonate/bicarbonate transport system substrate-binding protein